MTTVFRNPLSTLEPKMMNKFDPRVSFTYDVPRENVVAANEKCSACDEDYHSGDDIYICGKCLKNFHETCLFTHLEEEHNITFKDGLLYDGKVIDAGTFPTAADIPFIKGGIDL